MPRRLDELQATTVDLDQLVPPPRFGTVTFASFEPRHPSQAAARTKLEATVARLRDPIEAPQRGRWFSRMRRRAHGTAASDPGPGPRGLYLDGGFGVGKTHLLAAAFHAAPITSKRYLSFQELVYLIGSMGMARAREELGDAALFCIDEFELDDPGNTLIVKTFLDAAFARGATVLTTANTPPAAQGAGRFNADDFRREIQAMAARFEVLTVDGPDVRPAPAHGSLLEGHELPRPDEAPEFVHAEWHELLAHLAAHHPSRYRTHVAAMAGLVVQGASTIQDQGDALRLVHFVDAAYDRTLVWYLGGPTGTELFDPGYAEGAYAKKYGRCRSRLAEIGEEARAHRRTLTRQHQATGRSS